MRPYRYSLTVAFQDTNLVGNVYFAHYFAWQGKCREGFLRDHAPQILDDFRLGFGMITKDAECRFVREARAFDEIVIEMFLDQLTPLGVRMRFEYYRVEETGPVLLAEGSQSTMWVNPQHRPSMMPEYLYQAIKRFAQGPETAAQGTELRIGP
jgi:enediyne biosynthesis thioesterase